MNLTIKTASIDDLKVMMQWAATEGWNPGKQDINSYYLIDPNGFYSAYVNDQMIASVSCVQFSENYSFLGFFIVKPEYRFKKIGYELVKYLSEKIKAKENPHQTLAIDGVVNRIAKYEKLGFTLAHSTIRYLLPEYNNVTPKAENIVPITAVPLNAIADYDHAVFPANRFAFLMSWLTQTETMAIAHYDKKLSGFGAIRPATTGYRIGPLFADNAEIARTLFQQLCAKVPPNTPIFMDVPLSNKEAVTLCNDFNMQPTFETGRMYHGPIPTLSLDKIFGLTSLEVG